MEPQRSGDLEVWRLCRYGGEVWRSGERVGMEVWRRLEAAGSSGDDSAQPYFPEWQGVRPCKIDVLLRAVQDSSPKHNRLM